MKHISFFLFFILTVSFSPLFAEEKCTYEYDSKQTAIEWTAFKFTEKTGVKGKMESFKATHTKKAKTILDSLKDLRFTVQTSSLNSSVPDRDEKIKKFFFGSVKNGKEFKGNFSQIKGTNEGSATLNLEFNKIKKSVPVQFKITGDSIEVTGTLDVLELGLKEGISRLNEECRDLHKGADGTSKLWPTVDIKITSTLTKTCS
ncbi:YceI family protein [Leptospira idonii]|uniref:YceI family protein n=1 Tax=Leptospira idonii TaxID=1193500 RepID=A0A4R9M3L7_9LEPT|nr:YceI family protein [Leptospira idonii]TGN20475.1 YceI family protein [Leptospira idonii]